ncbi:MAG: AMP-binding protein, partial [Ilumatobacteraceae bacterium]
MGSRIGAGVGAFAEETGMAMTWEQACAAVTVPGTPLALAEGPYGRTVFATPPPSMREVFGLARDGGDAIFLVYEDERWTFDEVFARIDALADALVNHYGITKGERIAIGMRNYPEWVMSFAAIISVGAVSVSLNAMWTTDELAFG